MQSSLWTPFDLSGTGGSRIRAMEGLRGLAVSLVFLVHYTTLVEPWLAPESWVDGLDQAVRAIGNSGVDLFFVLSGYLIYGHLIARDVPFWPYLRRRVQRIYPTFLAVLAVYLVLSIAAPAHSKIPAGLLSAAQYLGENILLLPGVLHIEPMITVAWSLSYEMAYYLATPLVILALGMRHRPRLARCALLLAMALAGTGWQHVEGGDLRWIMFLSGALLFETQDWFGRLPDDVASLSFVIGLWLFNALRGIDGAGPLRVWVLFAAFYLLCLGCFTRRGLMTIITTWAPLRFLGNISYSYYFVHGLALQFFFAALRLVDPEIAGTTVFWALLPLAFACSIVPSVALFLLVEKRYSLSPKSHHAG